jgi:hypothetical protein
MTGPGAAARRLRHALGRAAAAVPRGAAPAGEARGRAGGAGRADAGGPGQRRAARGEGGRRRTVAVAATLSALGAALLLRPEGPPAPAAVAAAATVAAARPAPDDAGAVAVALEAGLEAGDAAAVLALFAPDAQVKEHVAVLAAGPARVAAWVEGCLLPDVRLVPGTRRLGAATAAWAVRDALGCYWRARPDGFRPAWDVAPGEGTLTVAVAGERIATLTIVYDPAWERRTLQAQAAPIRTAQALATARAAQTAAAAPATRAAERAAAPSTQDRRTPSVGPWLAALGAALGGAGLLALLPRPREAP